ncbi:MAG: hypothetical protein KAZ87_13360 [Spirochaetes bacterium]|nr:hypothetical protein [Spirochaetota bacterium]
MSHFKLFVMLTFIAVFSGSIFSQDMPEIDPETAEIMKNYQNQSENMPAEIKALIPASVKITDQNFAVEATTNMLLTSSIRANNWESGSKVQLEYEIIINVFNVKNALGKSTADSSLEAMRKEMLKNWTESHPVEKDGITIRNPYEKTAVSKGYYLIQKIFTPKHVDGEGTVPETTEYAGFLYLEIDNGILTSSTNECTDKKAIESMLKHTAAASAKIKWNSYFK